MVSKLSFNAAYGVRIALHAASGPIAHGLIGRHSEIVDIDDGYAALLGVARGAVIGMPMTDFIHPQDRSAAALLLEGAWAGGVPVHATQRLLSADGQSRWVDIHVSRLGADDRACLVVTSRPLPRGKMPSTVEAHWQMAKLLMQALDGGKRAFGDSLIGNPATEILLLAYVAEAEARAVEAGEIARRINVSWPLARRWLVALADAGFAESETTGPIERVTPVRLSPRALAMIEAIFGALVAVVQQSLVTA